MSLGWNSLFWTVEYGMAVSCRFSTVVKAGSRFSTVMSAGSLFSTVVGPGSLL